MSSKFPHKRIQQVFSHIPGEKLLAIAEEVQNKIRQGSVVFEEKSPNDWVTQADIAIQHQLLEYFAASELAGTYFIDAEEELTTEQQQKKGAGEKSWTLVIDPLDGTNAFKRGEKYWGVIVGACDNSGVLQESWAITSEGNVYSTANNANGTAFSLSQQLQKKHPLVLDYDDYDTGNKQGVHQALAQKIRCAPEEIVLRDYPSAMWVGWEVYQGNLDGFIWIASEGGKKTYPAYDLAFLATLKKQGRGIVLGKSGRENVLVLVAPNQEQAETLYEVGKAYLPLWYKENLENIGDTLLIKQ